MLTTSTALSFLNSTPLRHETNPHFPNGGA
jgi:hypothetical protein